MVNFFSGPAQDGRHFGTGYCVAQHGEIFQGQIEDPDGQLRRCLISLPCETMWSTARFTPAAECELRVSPPGKRKALRVVEIVLSGHAQADLGGLIEIESSVPEAKGYGSSTSDCIAAARAAADAIGVTLSDRELAAVVVNGELASDNLMFDHAVLFAHREGVVLEDYRKPLPPLEVVGIDTEPAGEVRTLEYPPAEYSWRDVETFHSLRGALRRAIRTQDTRLLGRVATASANINQRFLPKTAFEEILGLSRHAGALGINVAHSGTVIGILLDPSDPLVNATAEALIRELCSLDLGEVKRFHAGSLRRGRAVA